MSPALPTQSPPHSMPSATLTSDSALGVQSLQGIYMGGVLSSKGELRWLHLRQGETDHQIKLSKLIGYTLSGKLQPGTPIQVWARPKKDYLKALMVVPLEELPSSAGEPAASPSAAMPSPAVSSPAVAAPPQSQQRVCTVRVCTKGKCYKQGSHQLLQALENTVKAYNLQDQVAIAPTGCMKNCKRGPTIEVESSVRPFAPEQHSFVRPSDIPAILHRHTNCDA